MDEEILQALKDLTRTVNEGFSSVNERFTSIEERLSRQEAKSRRMYTRQTMTEDAVKKLEGIVYRLAKNEPCQSRPDGTAIRKEAAYREFENAGFGKVKATCTLRRAGVIKPDSNGKNSCTIWLNGKPTRVLIVVGGAEAGKNE